MGGTTAQYYTLGWDGILEMSNDRLLERLHIVFIHISFPLFSMLTTAYALMNLYTISLQQHKIPPFFDISAFDGLVVLGTQTALHNRYEG
jgi:hypothetical protein